MPTAGVLSPDGTLPHLLNEVRKKGSICAHGMLLSLHEYVYILSSHRRRIARGKLTRHERGE